jgi:hypothetical protein
MYDDHQPPPQPPIMPLGQPPNPQLPDPVAAAGPHQDAQGRDGLLSGDQPRLRVSPLVSAAYGSAMAHVFGFLFVVFGGWPLLFRRRR